MNSISCCSNVTRSALSSERKRYSVCVPLRRLRSLVCTMPRQLPGVTCTTFITRQRSFWCWTIMPTRSCVAGINMERVPPGGLRNGRVLVPSRLGGRHSPASLLHLFGRGGWPEDGRAVMVDDEPVAVAPLEDIRRL